MTFHRRCEHCGVTFTARREHARFCGTVCRSLAYKAKHSVPAAQNACKRRSGPSGRQVSYRKAVRAAADLLTAVRPDLTVEVARELAAGGLYQVLPDKQRRSS